MNMNFREAKIDDIKQIQIIRNSVTENILSNPDLVSDKDCEEYLTIRGKGWVCEINTEIVGFSIVDLKEDNVWALFVIPKYEKLGIGRKLHYVALIGFYFIFYNKEPIGFLKINLEASFENFRIENTYELEKMYIFQNIKEGGLGNLPSI